MKLTARQKGIRTALQVLLGVVALVPALAIGLGVPAGVAAAVGAASAFAGGVVAVIQNALEANGILPVLAPRRRRRSS